MFSAMSGIATEWEMWHYSAMGIARTPLADRFWAKVDKSGDCWLWTGATTDFGHGVINAGGNRGKAIRAHRVSWEFHNGPIPDGLFVCHHCDVPRCVNPAHLFLGTNAENMRDCANKGRYDRVKRPKGAQHGMSKLSPEQVIELRKDYDSEKFVLRELAEKYGISIPHAHRLGKRMNYTVV